MKRILFTCLIIIICVAVLVSCVLQDDGFTLHEFSNRYGSLTVYASNRWQRVSGSGEISLIYGNDLAFTNITIWPFWWAVDETAPSVALQGAINGTLQRTGILNPQKVENVHIHDNNMTINQRWYRAYFNGNPTYYCFSYILFCENENIYLIVVQTMLAGFFSTNRQSVADLLLNIEIRG